MSRETFTAKTVREQLTKEKNGANLGENSLSAMMTESTQEARGSGVRAKEGGGRRRKGKKQRSGEVRAWINETNPGPKQTKSELLSSPDVSQKQPAG